MHAHCAGASDEEEDARYVVAEYAIDQRSSMDTVEIVDDIWQKAQGFMQRSGTHMGVRHIGKADDLYLFEKRWKSKVLAHTSVSTISCADVELEPELQSTGAS